MPPALYVPLHRAARLSTEERHALAEELDAIAQ